MLNSREEGVQVADMVVAVVRGYARDIIPLSAFQSDPSEGVRHSDAKE